MTDTGSPAQIAIAVVGCGIRGLLFATALSQNPRVSVEAVVDANMARAKELGRAVRASAYATVTEMLDQHPGISAAIIATPDFAHTEPALECVSRGLHLMIEKPLATDVESATKIVDAASAANIKVMVAFENRWNARFIEARRLVDNGDLGKITNMIAQLNDTIFVPTQMLPWAGSSSPAWFLMPHTLDLALWLTGATPVEVYAKGTRGLLDERGVGTWDAITALFGLSNGAMLTLQSSWVLPVSMPAVFEMNVEIQGSDAVLEVDGATHGITLFGKDRASWPQLGVNWWRDQIRGFPVDMVNDFIRFLLDEDVSVPGARDGLVVTAAIDAVHRSLDMNRAVPLAAVDDPKGG